MFPRDRQIDHADVPAKFTELCPTLFSGARVLNVFAAWAADPAGTRHHVFTRAVFSDEPVEDQWFRDFDTMLSRQFLVPVERAAGLISSLPRHGLACPAAGEPTAEATGGIRVQYLRRRSWRKWSTYRLLYCRQRAFDWWTKPGLPLTSATSAPFQDRDHYVAVRCRLPGWQHGHDYNPAVMVECEDRRGRVAKVYFSDVISGDLRVDIDSSDDVVASVGYVAVADRAELVRGMLERDDAGWSLHVPTEWTYITLTATTETGECVDIENQELAGLRSEQLVGISPTALRAMVDGEEHGQLDFKSWKSLTLAHSAKVKILKDVVAFANSQGGTLLFGRTKHRDLDGPEAIANEAGVLELGPEENQVARDLLSVVAEEVAPSVDVQLAFGHLDGRLLLALSVSPGAAVPYSTKGGTFYTRRGAHSEPMNRTELLALVARDADFKRSLP